MKRALSISATSLNDIWILESDGGIRVLVGEKGPNTAVKSQGSLLLR